MSKTSSTADPQTKSSPFDRLHCVAQSCPVLLRNGQSCGHLVLLSATLRIVRAAVKVKVKAFPYAIPSVGPGAGPGLQAVSPQVTVSHPPSGRLPLISARPAVNCPAAEHHRPLDGSKLYCLVTEAHGCKQLAQGCYAALPRVGFEPATY